MVELRTCYRCGEPKSLTDAYDQVHSGVWRRVCKCCRQNRANVRRRKRYNEDVVWRTRQNIRQANRVKEDRLNPTKFAYWVHRDSRASDKKRGLTNDMTLDDV